MKVCYSNKYSARIAGHVFRADKFGAALKLAQREGYFPPSEIISPELPTKAELELAHTRGWVSKCMKCRFTPGDSLRAEMDISREVVEAHLLNVGGTIKAAELALASGAGLNCGGGGHHAFADGGEGFCLLNDMAVAIRKLQRQGRIKRAVVIDLDAHQGNGTAAIFSGDQSVFTFSMHNEEIYPEIKGRSSLDIGLRPGWRDGEYLAVLKAELPRVMENFKPDFAMYVAGADVYRGDLLGGLKLSMGGIKKRDAFVLRECRERGVPVAVVLSGGYAKNFGDTVRIHANTLIEAVKAFRG